MNEKLSRRGRPSHDDRAALTQRPKPEVRLPEGARFEIFGSPDDRAGVEHYWARLFFYSALRSYAPTAYAELQAVAHEEDRSAQPASTTAYSKTGVTGFSRFLGRLSERLPTWCRRYHMLVGSDEVPIDDREPGWLAADLIDSYMQWHPKHGSLHLSAFWRARGIPVEIDGELIDANPDSAELRALLRIDLIRSEVDESGATVPVVISEPAAMKELVTRFKAFVYPELRSLLATAKDRGIHKPSEAVLDTVMRRYVLKQFRWLDSRDIAAGEARGDDACTADSTDEDREVHEFSARRRDVDDGIRTAADLLGVPARTFPPGPRPKQSLAERRG